MAGQVDPDIATIIARNIAEALKRGGLDYRQQGKIILEPGCGQGFMTRALEEQFPTARVYGIDMNNLYIDIARRLGRKVVRGDMNQMPIKEASIDMAVTSNVFDFSGREEPIQIEQTLPEICRVLKVGGVYVASADQHNIEPAMRWWPDAFAGFEHRYKNAIQIFVKIMPTP